jgi:hypothetical protein
MKTVGFPGSCSPGIASVRSSRLFVDSPLSAPVKMVSKMSVDRVFSFKTHGRWQPFLPRLFTSTLAATCSIVALADQPTLLGREPLAAPLGDSVFDAVRDIPGNRPAATGLRDFLRPMPRDTAQASELALSAARLTRIQLGGSSAAPRVTLRSASPQERRSSQPAPPPLFRLSRAALPLLIEPLTPSAIDGHRGQPLGSESVAGIPSRCATLPAAPLQGPAVGGFAGYRFRSSSD